MKTYIWTALAIMTVGLSLFLLCRPPFIVTEAKVIGTFYVPQRDVENALGTLEGNPIWLTWAKCQVRKRTLLKRPQVEGVDVQLHFPNRISVRVIEYRPWISFLAGGGHFMVAENGTILNRENQLTRLSDIEQTIIIRGVPIDRFSADHIDEFLLSDVKLLLENVRLVLPIERFQIEFLDDTHYILYKDDTLPIKLGRLEDMTKKLKNLRRFLASDAAVDTAKIEYIDLSMADRVVVRRRS